MTRLAAWALGTVSFALGVAAVTLAVVGDDLPALLRSGHADAWVIATVGAVLSLIILQRRPRHPIGWLLLGNAAVQGAAAVTDWYAVHANDHPHTLSGGDTASRLLELPLILAALTLVLVLLLSPEGRELSARWRPTVIIASADAAVSLLASIADFTAVTRLGQLVMAACALVGVASLEVRYRTASGVLRQQVKWIAFGMVPTVLLVIAAHAAPGIPGGILAMVSPIPGYAGFTIAIRRYRLFEIDRFISRSVAYLALTIALGVVFVLGAVLFGEIAGVAGGGSNLATAGATLTVVIFFQPLRRRLQDAADRRFQRRSYDATRILQAYVDSLRDHEPRPGALRATLAAAIADPTVQLAFWLPETGGYVDEVGDDVSLPDSSDRVVTRIERRGEELGAIVHHLPGADGASSALTATVRASPLAFAHGRLRAQVMRHLAEARASRARLVAAGDAERRRLERDLHDGAQQRLVALRLELRMAQRAAGRAADPVLTRTIDHAEQELQAAVDELRRLAHGLVPAALTDAGLVAALEELASRAALDVTVNADSSERAPPGIEVAAYFVASEALANAAKHASATHIALDVSHRDHVLVVRIADDGIGGADIEAGTGIRGLIDRVEAHQGRLSLESPAGRGTTMTAEFPCAS
jgi:signal transduction histidine kinase